MTATLTRNNLWTAVSAKLDEIFPNGHGLNRDEVWYTSDDRQCRTKAWRKMPDGTNATFEITAADHYGRIEVTVVEGVDNSDWFWQPIADETAREKRVVIGDQCLTIEPDSPNPGWGDGYGGQRFDIEWLDEAGEPTGEVTVTRNLWHRGTIPPAWRDRLKPNARHATKEVSD